MPETRARWPLAMLLLACSAALAAPSAKLWPRWEKHDAHSHKTLDYSAWNAILKQYVVPAEDGLNRFQYDQVSDADRKALAAFLTRMQAVRIDDYNRAVQRAYWVNLYNAATVSLVLEHYPVKSILDIKLGGLFSIGPWSAKWLKVEGVSLSLNDIEHRILRPIWHTPLIHYAVNCASVGCPNLAPQAYTAANFEQLAVANARAYVNSPRGVQIDDGKLNVSSIYKWFESDFGGNDASVIAHLEKYADPKLKKKLQGIRRIAGDHYDWSLNGMR